MIPMISATKQRPMPHNLANYERCLRHAYLSPNTIKVYLASVYSYYNIYSEITAKKLDEYKTFLEAHYSPRSVNLHIIGMNRYLNYIGKPELKLHIIRFRQKNYLDEVVNW